MKCLTMKHLIALLPLLATLPVSAWAESSTPPPATTTVATQGAAPQVVAPRQVLALDRILPGTTEDKVKALLPDEVRALVNLYLGGKIRQWYFRQDRPGAVLILEVGDMDEAERIVGSLPLTRGGLLAYDLIPIGPYVPLATLLPPEAAGKRKKR
ncbi:MAG: hypothetical protein ACLGHE_02920 [Gammaproteobacteria bacterium]